MEYVIVAFLLDGLVVLGEGVGDILHVLAHVVVGGVCVRRELLKGSASRAWASFLRREMCWRASRMLANSSRGLVAISYNRLE